MKQIGTCSTCDFYEVTPSGGTLSHPVFDSVCTAPQNQDTYNGKHRDGVHPIDWACYHASISPDPFFGCIHWKPIPTQPKP
jgi:hypothetical protein